MVEEFRTTGKKKGEGEDPSVTAQRFLNIFKQLHIFTPEKKTEFDSMILAQPSEVRGAFSSLPGGSLLQEYVDELELKSGIVRAKAAPAAPEAVTEKKVEASTTAYATPVAKVDEGFAKELAGAFSEIVKSSEKNQGDSKEWFKQALQISEENRKRDSFELTKMIAESQNKMAKMLLQTNTLNNPNNTASNIQIHAAGAANTAMHMEEVISHIVRAQSEILSNAARSQTRELSTVISMALKESQKLSTQTIVDAISAFQKENMRIFQSQSKNVTIKTDTNNSISSFDEDDDDEVGDAFEPEIKKKKKKKKNKNRQGDIGLAEFLAPSEPESMTISGLDESLFDIDHSEPHIAPKPEPRSTTETIEIDDDDPIVDILNDLVKEVNNQKLQSQPIRQEKQPMLEQKETFAPAPEFVPTPVIQPEPLLTDAKDEEEDKENWEWQEVSNNAEPPATKIIEEEEEDEIVEDSQITAGFFENEDDSVVDINQSEDGGWGFTTPPAPQVQNEEPTSDDDWEWEYEEVDENGNPIEASADGDWEWEYVEDDDHKNDAYASI